MKLRYTWLLAFALATTGCSGYRAELRERPLKTMAKTIVPYAGAWNTAEKITGKIWPYYADEGLLVWDAEAQRLVHLPDVKITGGADPLTHKEALTLATENCVTEAGFAAGHKGNPCQ